MSSKPTCATGCVAHSKWTFLPILNQTRTDTALSSDSRQLTSGSILSGDCVFWLAGLTTGVLVLETNTITRNPTHCTHIHRM